MRAHLAAAMTIAALGFGVASVGFAGAAYSSVVEARAAVPFARVLYVWGGIEPDPTLPGYPALPDADHLPASFTPQQREDATLWLKHYEYAAECMADAGFPGYRYFAHWQTGMSSETQNAWQAEFSPAEVQRAMETLHGVDPPVPSSGLDYEWERSGCQGYGWHMVGIDYPIIY